MAGDDLLMLGTGSLAVGLAAIVLVLSTGRAQRQAVSRSLAAIDGHRSSGPVVLEASFTSRVLLPALAKLSRLGMRLSGADAGTRIQRRLDLAGNPDGLDVQRVLGAKAFGLLAGVLVGAYLGHARGLFMTILFAAVGGLVFFLPDVLLYNTGTKRQETMQQALPDSLDLLTISVEAGLGFDAAVAQVARNTEGPLAADFFRLMQEMQIGKTRSEAFRALADRSDIAELKGFTSAIVQADTLGIPVAQVLRQQADEMRVKRMQRAEEKAMKVPVKILFPTVLFILPALFVVIIGPGAISIARTL